MKWNLIIATLLLANRQFTTSPADDAPVPDGLFGFVSSFKWDRVPVNIHFGKRRQMTDAELDFIAAHSEFVVLEQSHGIEPHGSTEKGIADTARRLKEHNPRFRVLFYCNAFVNWPGYDAFATYRPEWILKSANGHVVKHPSGTPRPDPSNAQFREWWSDVVAAAVKNGKLNGVLADALLQSRSPFLTKTIGAEKQEALVDGLRRMMYLPPLFPTLLRTTGAGFFYSIGRITAAFGTVFFGLFSDVFSRPGDHHIALFYAGFLFLPAAGISLFLPRAKD